MRKISTVLMLGFLMFGAKTTFGQADQGSLYVSGTGGVIMPLQKSNMDFADKLLFGVEANYFVANGVSITGGMDYLLAGNQTMAVFGTRLYPGANTFYFRHKAMVNVKNRYNSDFMVGVGNDFPINDKLAAELNLDYHFIYKAVGLKFGLALTL